MPKKEINDYFFYKIVCIDTAIDLCYVGSTVNWKKRKQHHKDACNSEKGKEYNQKKYQIIRANGSWENWKMVQIGYREQLTVRQAETVEEEYRKELKASMNSQKCFITPEERKEQQKEMNKQYREANKYLIYENNKQYKEQNKEKFKEYNKKYSKEYRKANEEKIKERDKQYKEANKSKIEEKKSRPYTCSCGSIIRWDHKSIHFRSKKHQKLIQIQLLEKTIDI